MFKLTTKLFTYIFITLSLFWNVFAEGSDISITDIDSKNPEILKILLDTNVETDTMDVTSDIRVFKDLDDKKISIDAENNKLVHLSLEKGLELNTSYSLLSVYGAEWTIDFQFDDLTNWGEIEWDTSDWIEKLVISNWQNLDIYFRDPIESDSVDIKLLREFNIESLKMNTENTKELDVRLKSELHDGSKYIVMMFAVNTQEDLSYSVSNSIYDFVTQEEMPVEDQETPTETQEIPMKNIEEPVEDTEISLENTEVTMEDMGIPIEDEATSTIALNSAETPETWAETWILIFATLLLSNFIYFRKKLFKS